METTKMLPRELRFEHNGGHFQAILVDESPLSTNPCVVCSESLYGRAFYTTFPPLFDVHADCARKSIFLKNIPGAGHRSLHRERHNGAAANHQDRYYQWYGQQQAPQGNFAQGLGGVAIGAFLQALFKVILEGLGFGP